MTSGFQQQHHHITSFTPQRWTPSPQHGARMSDAAKPPIAKDPADALRLAQPK